jgi:hypothetical protein
VAIGKLLFRVTKNVTEYRSKRQKVKNYDEKRGAVGFRGNSQSGDNCQENDFVAIDCGASRVTKKQTVFRYNRLDQINYTQVTHLYLSDIGRLWNLVIADI